MTVLGAGAAALKSNTSLVIARVAGAAVPSVSLTTWACWPPFAKNWLTA